MFNPRPRIEPLPIAEGRTAWVIDDVLADPRGWVEIASEHAARFEAAPFNAYPGLEWRMGPEVDQPLAEFFAQHIRSRLGFRRTLSMYSRLSIATLQPHQLRPLQRLCHRDRLGTGEGQGVAACVLYLFEDPALGGTAFYAPRRPIEQIDADIRRWNTLSDDAFTQEIGAAPAYLTTNNAHFELLASVPAAFNRAVFYDGGGFHSSHISTPEKLSADPARGRLTLNGFFTCRRAAT
jgi:hypothetical protein